MPVRQDPPGTRTLEAFVRAAEASSLSVAAKTLGLTQSAVSQRIASLERQLGARLFLRTPAGVILTSVGEAYLPAVRTALDGLRHAQERIVSRKTAVRLSVVPSFARCWLLPRLGKLATAHPDVDIVLHVSDERVEVDDGGYDLAVRLSRSAADSIRLFDDGEDERVVVVARSTRIVSDADDPFAGLTLYHDDCSRLGVPAEQGWTQWYEATERSRPAWAPGIVVNDASMAAGAAIAGQGVALVRRLLVRDHLLDGTLATLGPPLPHAGRTTLITRRRTTRTASADRVADWLVDEASRGCAEKADPAPDHAHPNP